MGAGDITNPGGGTGPSSESGQNAAQIYSNAAQTFPSTPTDSTTTQCTNPSKYSAPSAGGSQSSTPQTQAEINKATATNFYKSTTNWPDEKIASHLEGIDFNQPVDVVTLPKGTPTVQYQVPGRPTGNYFAPPGTSPESIGVNPAGRVPTTYIANRNVRVLRSTAANTEGNKNLPPLARGKGGGTQFFTGDTSAFEK
jgi:hypothetical protein